MSDKSSHLRVKTGDHHVADTVWLEKKAGGRIVLKAGNRER